MWGNPMESVTSTYKMYFEMHYAKKKQTIKKFICLCFDNWIALKGLKKFVLM